SIDDPEVLIVDDDAELAYTLRDLLLADGCAVAVALSPQEALEIQAKSTELAVALIDLVMPQCNGLALMDEMHRRDADLPVVIMTGFGTIESAVEAIKHGAEDYLTKPFDQRTVKQKVGRILELKELRYRVAELEKNYRQVSDPFRDLVFVSPAMQKVVEKAKSAAQTDTTVLIVGETGTGKGKLARAIHFASRRSAAPFVPVNCGALPHDLIESELFGVRRGAFTGAYSDAPGLFVSASRGTVFLDEISEMPKEAQVKLLRVLQEKELRPIGASRPVPVDVRVIAATNRPLQQVRSQALREDLYFRLATVVIEIPPLRQRCEDILVFAQSYAARLADRYGRHITVSGGGMELLLRYPFPGNVRELENMLESMTALSHDDPQTITEKELRPLIALASDPMLASDGTVTALEDVEHVAIERAIRLCGGNRTRAAALLGISRDTLYRKLRDTSSKANTR
ncbi:MAG: sigma-54-dependent transcriptional regulator, partial [Terriglobales bacterium]